MRKLYQGFKNLLSKLLIEVSKITVNGAVDLSKADVSVNIHAWLKAQRIGQPVELCCATGDDAVDGMPYPEIVEEAREYIRSLGGFEAFAEGGLIR